MQLVTLTENAIKRFEELLSSNKEAVGIRIQITTKGCSGLSWQLDFCNEDNGFDEKLKVNDKLTVYVDPKAVLFVIGTTIDYAVTDIEEGFVFKNPNEQGRCGCGDSFYV